MNRPKLILTVGPPGCGKTTYAQEYIKEHRERIEQAAPKLTHLKWSAVGDLLFDIPGENSEFLAINEELHQNDPIERMKYNKQKINGEKLIEIIESSMSSPISELLKRPDENAVVMNAHKNPVFVEDCVRTMNEKILEEFSYLPDDTLITTRQENHESIHRHNAYAEKVSTLGSLKEELNL